MRGLVGRVGELVGTVGGGCLLVGVFSIGWKFRSLVVVDFTSGIGLGYIALEFFGGFWFFFSRMGRSCDTGHGELSFLLGGCVKEKWVLISGSICLFVCLGSSIACLLRGMHCCRAFGFRVRCGFFAWGFGSVGLLLCEVGLMGFCFFGCGLVPKGSGGREGGVSDGGV